MEYIKCGQADCVEFCEQPEVKKEITSRMDRMNLVRKKCKQKMTEKTAIATTINTYIDNYTKKLDTDLSLFEKE